LAVDEKNDFGNPNKRILHGLNKSKVKQSKTKQSKYAKQNICHLRNQ